MKLYQDVFMLFLQIYSQRGNFYIDKQMNMKYRPFRFICFCYMTTFL